MTLTVAAYLWTDPASRSKFQYGADDVRALQRMVARHLTVPHQFACITDRPHLFDADRNIRAIPLDWATHVPATCFVKLFTFHPEGASIFGERILGLDLDTLIVRNIDHLAMREENLVLWRNPSRIPWHKPAKPGRPFYNTSVVLHRCGTSPLIWEMFKPNTPGCRDDQWWVSDFCGPGVPYFDGERDGVYRIGRTDTPGSGVNGELPANACIVTAPGSEGKFTEPHIAAANPWIAEHRC